jgi:hypothetical protein
MGWEINLTADQLDAVSRLSNLSKELSLKANKALGEMIKEGGFTEGIAFALKGAPFDPNTDAARRDELLALLKARLKVLKERVPRNCLSSLGGEANWGSENVGRS